MSRTPPQMDLLAFGLQNEEKKKDKEKNSAQEPTVYSVSQLNREIKRLLEGKFALLWVRGEISNFKAHSSGHFYFSLKDEKSQMNAVMFKGHNRSLRFRPEDGMEVLIRGRVTVYEPRGNYQVFCETMEPVGAGALQMAFEQLKAKLKAEGLFSSERKRSLPALPRHVALVTSPTGAAVQDMLNVLRRRFRGLEVTVFPCRVQGRGAAATIVEALQKVELYHRNEPVDVVICGRGGGSMEDLWAFNEEVVARKISEMSMPLVSAVGHEVDFTIADFVADLRAPTPSAAAELVVKNAMEMKNLLHGQQRRLQAAGIHRLRHWRQRVESFHRRLIDPKRNLQDMAIRCDDLLQRLQAAAFRYLSVRETQVSMARQALGHPRERLWREQQKLKSFEQELHSAWRFRLGQERERFQRANSLLESYSPLKVVERGYAIATKGEKLVKDAGELKPGDRLELRLARGSVVTEVKETKD